MEINLFKKYLIAIGFSPKDGENEVFHKEYTHNSNYEIFITLKHDLRNSKINWGKKITVTRLTSSDFSKPESWVVLECVNRLLEKGYKPEKIVLEKQWKLGHKGKGFLDIQVLDESGNSFLLIECKTWGKEHEKEKNNILRDGGQLFSYLVQERNSQYICLYSSVLENNKINFQNDVVVINNKIKSSKNQKEAFEAWNPQVFEKKGVFEYSGAPYNIKFVGIIKSDLRSLTELDGGNIFNRFAEILRKNVVSDKTNAFNKIFNLFLCKIVDEDKRRKDEEIKFQWKQNETNESVLLRLNDLYKEGMKEYLNLDISAVSEKELESSLRNIGSEEGREALKKIFIQQKLYSGNEFAFKEVFDKDSFKKNCIVVKEIVKLLEEYRIKYQHRQQFLGDFFEKLLNTGIKQESGQFFTPIPLTSFVCKALPIKSIIENKNTNGEINFLPYVIDFASGSGHFLTEVMSEIDKHVKGITKEENWIKGGKEAEKRFNAHKDDYYWAEEYIYGIEKDYRLAKTTKISTFLNGDGDANIICADGLDHFSLSKDYTGKLKTLKDGKNNEEFDILIANPPYSVSGFKTTVSHGKDSFEFYKHFTDKSNEIECLFIERLNQLLKEGGVAGIILPIIILTGGKLHKKARELILKNFEIKGMLEVGGGAFMEAGIKTVIVFLKKRRKTYFKEIEMVVNNFFKNLKDFSWKEENIVKNYVTTVFGENVSLGDYIDFLHGKSPKRIKETELGRWYIDKYDFQENIDEIISLEKEKLNYFVSMYNQKVVLVKSGEKQQEKEFLGYEFSNRKGSEGIKIYEDGKLFNPSNLFDEKKVNSYILNNFLDDLDDEIDESLKNNLVIKKMHSIIDFKNTNFDAKITTKQIEDIEINSVYPLEPLESLFTTLESGSRPKGGVSRIKEGIPSVGGEHIGQWGNIVFDNKKKFIPSSFFESASQGQISNGDILICKDGAQTGKIAYVDKKFKYNKALVNEHVFLLRANDIKIMQVYLFNFLLTDIGQKILRSKTTGSAQGGLNRPSLLAVKIPVPDRKIQQKIIDEIGIIEKAEVNLKENILLNKKQEIIYKYINKK